MSGDLDTTAKQYRLQARLHQKLKLEEIKKKKELADLARATRSVLQLDPRHAATSLEAKDNEIKRLKNELTLVKQEIVNLKEDNLTLQQRKDKWKLKYQKVNLYKMNLIEQVLDCPEDSSMMDSDDDEAGASGALSSTRRANLQPKELLFPFTFPIELYVDLKKFAANIDSYHIELKKLLKANLLMEDVPSRAILTHTIRSVSQQIINKELLSILSPRGQQDNLKWPKEIVQFIIKFCTSFTKEPQSVVEKRFHKLSSDKFLHRVQTRKNKKN